MITFLIRFLVDQVGKLPLLAIRLVEAKLICSDFYLYHWRYSLITREKMFLSFLDCAGMCDLIDSNRI